VTSRYAIDASGNGHLAGPERVVTGDHARGGNASEKLAPEGGKVLRNIRPEGGILLRKTSDRGPYLVGTDSILDLFARRVVGWSVGDQLSSDLAALALRRALDARRPRAGLIVHNDRGGEFLSRSWRKELERKRARASASATGSCFDNAVAESFFSTLEFEGPSTRLWRDVGDAELALPGFLDRWYNHERLHSFNGYESPVATESRWQLNRLAA
jgi:transposase InsO family protein